MISRPVGFTWELTRGGVRLVGGDGTVVHYIERARPMRTAVAIVEDLTGQRATPERMITDEGEYGAIVRLPERTIGIVFGDDFYALVDGIGPSREVVEELARTDLHMLGVRRRRFWYVPPPRWQGFLAGPFHAHWIGPEYPSDPAQLLVLPALPGVAPAAVRDALATELERVEPITIGSLVGQLCSARDRHLLVLEDNRYLYALELTDPLGRHRDDLLAVARSIEPLPNRGRQPAPAFDWITR